jgi:hypothetical protein
MDRLKICIAWIYGLQVFLVLPWFLGSIYRGELPLWAWEEVTRDAVKNGSIDAALVLYLYLVFYSSLITIPYCVLCCRYSDAESGWNGNFRGSRLVLSGWLATSCFLFADPLFAFIHSLPSEVWNGWLLILWTASVVFVFRLVRKLEQLDKECPKPSWVCRASTISKLIASPSPRNLDQ